MPQGLILGPLFLLYINDLCNVSKALDFILFAEDTYIFFSQHDPNQVMEILNNELKKLSSWFQANKLSIDIKKSNFILLKIKQNRQKLDLHFSINDVEIDSVNESFVLEIIILSRGLSASVSFLPKIPIFFIFFCSETKRKRLLRRLANV